MSRTIVVNLFAGPGAGKSTGAAFIFSQLKMAGVDAELVTEFAKDKVWEKSDSLVFKSQLYIFGEQSWRMSRCKDKVQVIVTDSPLILQSLYVDKSEPWYDSFLDVVKKESNKYKNKNYFIRRSKDYNPNERNQNEEEAKKLDSTLITLLNDLSIPYDVVAGNTEGYMQIVEEVLQELKNLN